MKMKLTIITILIITITALIISSKNQKVSNEEYTIGFFGPLTGDLSNLGNTAKNGVNLAIEEIKNNLSSNQSVRVVFEDSKCDAKSATKAVKKLIEIDKVDALVGGLCSGETLSAAPIAEENKIPMISYCSSSPDITHAGKYIYRVYPSDNFQGTFIAEYISRKFDSPKVATLHIQDDWGNGIYKTFEEKYSTIGKIIYDQSFSPDTKDFRTEITKIKSANPDVVFFIGQTSVSVPFLKQAKSMDLKSVIFGGDVWADPSIESLPESEGVYYSVVNSDWSNEFTKKYEKRFETKPLVCAPQSYDAVKLIFNALNQRYEITDYLDKINNYQGASGIITFDNNGDLADAKYKVMQIINNGSVKAD